MIPKLVAFLLTMAVLIAAGIIILMLMLVAMNGYAESDAMWGLGTYILLALLAGAAMGTGAAFLTGRMLKSGSKPFVAAAISVPIFSLAGIVAEAICSLIGVAVAEIVRVNF
jgi:sorbitol-specific phosphotransferase system component IIC